MIILDQVLKKKKIGHFKIKKLSKTLRLLPALVQQISVPAVLSETLYDSEIWCKNKKTPQNKLQKLINGQSCSIHHMYIITSSHSFITETGLICAYITLDFWQSMYAYRLLSILDWILTKNIVPISSRIGEKNIQPENQLVLDCNEVSNQ